MQGIYLGFFSLHLAKLVGSCQNDENVHKLVRFGFAQATKLLGQDFFEDGGRGDMMRGVEKHTREHRHIVL